MTKQVSKGRKSYDPRMAKPARARKRNLFHLNSSLPIPESATFIGDADEAVRPMLADSAGLGPFLDAAGQLTAAERLKIVEQAIALLEGFYVHMPLKRAMHGVDPLQRLRLLRKRIDDIGSDLQFHAEMTRIFTSVRDLHTNYLLPVPFSGVVASLPFRVEHCIDNAQNVYIVTKVATGFQHPTFGEGVEILFWNGTPIHRAVELAADRHAGSNLDARFARGLAGLTQRPLRVAPAPDEEWVSVVYKTQSGDQHETRLDWLVTPLPAATGGGAAEAGFRNGTSLGLDLETDLVQQTRRILFAPKTFADGASQRAQSGDEIPTEMSGVFTAQKVTTKHGTFGHIRIWTFSVPDAGKFVGEFVRLAELLPQDGLIIDVRDNGGGLITAGEQLLQTLTPRQVEPERVQFINSALTLRLCDMHSPSPVFTDFDLSPWVVSMRRSIETGAVFSAGFPISSVDDCNSIGQRYFGPTVLITNARCYSTTDIFAAGFQDHEIGPVLGADGNTGAGGANVWTHDLLRQLFSKDGDPANQVAGSPFTELPRQCGMRVSIRRTVRVGTQQGTELEDLGVVPDARHHMTRRDLLDKNKDLFDAAGKLLADIAKVQLTCAVQKTSAGKFDIKIDCKNINRIDVYTDSRPSRSDDVSNGKLSFSVDGAKTLRIQGFQQDKLVASRLLTL